MTQKPCSSCQRADVPFAKNQRYCKACQSEKRKQYWTENRARESARNSKYHCANKGRRSEQFKEWAAKNREHLLSSKRARYAAQRDALAESNRQRVKAWSRLNPGKKRAAGARHRAARIGATPRWLTKQDRAEIRAIYEAASNLGPTFHVDHEIPLRGANVCGLHVPWNLRIITAQENTSKGNRLQIAA